MHVEHLPLQPSRALLRIGLAAGPIDQDRVLFHKTAHRTVYDRARAAGHDETVLWNTHGEITEAATANIVVEPDGGAKVTPSVACGLAGTFRAEVLARGTISGCDDRGTSIGEPHLAH